MKKVCGTVGVLLFALCVQATPYVTNVVAKQRYPWNGKVDIVYEVVGNDETLGSVPVDVTIIDPGGDSYTATDEALLGDVGFFPGIHRICWDLDIDGIKVLSPNARVVVEYDYRYLVIDVSGGADVMSYPVSHIAEAPITWGDEFKTSKIVLRKCKAHCFGNKLISTDIYAGVFEVTQGQWANVMGGAVASTDEQKPIAGLPATSDFLGTPMKFISKLRDKTGLNRLVLPTTNQWLYVSLAGRNTRYCFGDDHSLLRDYAVYNYNYPSSATTFAGSLKVGSRLPNRFGLYDVHGNISELCRETYSYKIYDEYGKDTGTWRSAVRYFGGNWYSSCYTYNSVVFSSLTAKATIECASLDSRTTCGFRLYME